MGHARPEHDSLTTRTVTENIRVKMGKLKIDPCTCQAHMGTGVQLGRGTEFSMQCSQEYWKEKTTFFCHITHIWCVGESK